jgi:hypothetical protein
MEPFDPHVMIQKKEAEILSRRRELDLLEAELRGMKAMVSHFPAFETKHYLSPIGGSAIVPSILGSVGSPRGGRQPGAISHTWRIILSELYWLPRLLDVQPGFQISSVIDIAKTQNILLRPSEAQTRIAHYESFDFVRKTDSGFVVTEHAAKKFGFDKEPLKNKAPDAKAQEPHESVRKADQTGAV